jgi:hypothetical protein
MIIGRLTGQIGKNRLTFNSEYQHRCEGTPLKVDTPGCHNRGSDWIGLGNNVPPTFQSPEATSTATRGYFDAPYYLNQATWTRPQTSKLLLEAGYAAFRYNPLFGFPPPDGITTLIPVTEQSNAINPATGLQYAPQPNYTYRGVEQWGWAVGKTDGWQASASYVTGAHNMKVGYLGSRLDQLDQTLTDSTQLAYRFNQGVPNAVTYRLPWTDSNNNKTIDCDLTNPSAQDNTATGGDICAAAVGNAANFGKPGSATIVNPDMLHGWGKRPGDYQLAATLQQEIVSGVTAEVSYTRRNFFGFFVTDDLNRNVNTGYETYALTAPKDPRLPNGGGYPITVYAQTAAANAIPSKTYLTWESDYGPERTSYWHGVDFTLNARFRGRMTASLGTSTSRAVFDDCAVATKYNQINTTTNVAVGPDPRGCHSVDPFQTTVRGLATYIIPKIEVLVSATVRSQPPLQLGAPPIGASAIASGGNSAQWIVPNSVIAAALGHLPFGSNPNGTTTIQLTDNANRVYVDNRRNQVDVRFAKVLRFGRTQSDVGLDINNLLNTNYGTNYNTTYAYSVNNAMNGGTWGNPTSLYTARFLRINYTINF